MYQMAALVTDSGLSNPGQVLSTTTPGLEEALPPPKEWMLGLFEVFWFFPSPLCKELGSDLCQAQAWGQVEA